MSLNLEKLRTDHLSIQHDVTFYPYQEDISNRTINAVLQNLRLTRNATEEDVKKLRLIELPIEISRQAGKTTAVVHTAEILMTFVASEFNRPIRIGIFAPQIEQARTDFERLKNALRPVKELMISDDEEKRNVKERENAKTLVLPNGSMCWIAPITTTSKPESQSFDLMIFEEAQDINDKIMMESVWPMGASTNAPRIYIGTAGTRKCYFKKVGESPKAMKIYFEEVVKQRREVYKRTGDATHLIYEQTVRQEIEKHGIDSDEIQRPYFGKWLLGSGQFVTTEDLNALIDEDRKQTYHDKKHEYFVGIDTAKHPDSTVVTMLRYNPERKLKEITNWMELRGENYKNQFDIIMNFIAKYNVVAIAIDSTGQGQFMPDWISQETEYADEKSGLYEIKFSAVMKDAIYRNLKVSIQKLLTRLPQLDTKLGERFREQMLDLQQEYKGQLLSVAHPDDPNAHDDYSDSWALAEWAYARWNEESGGQLIVFDKRDEQKKQNVKKQDNKITEYWPGMDW